MNIRDLNIDGIFELAREAVSRPAKPSYLLTVASECRRRGLLATEDALLVVAASRVVGEGERLWDIPTESLRPYPAEKPRLNNVTWNRPSWLGD